MAARLAKREGPAADSDAWRGEVRAMAAFVAQRASWKVHVAWLGQLAALLLFQHGSVTRAQARALPRLRGVCTLLHAHFCMHRPL